MEDAQKALRIALRITRGYKTGTSNVPKDGLYLTQEEGGEIIFSKTHGMLTPLEQGDMVLTAEQSQRLFDFAKNPSGFMGTTPLNIAQQIHILQAQHNVTIGDIHIELPDVQNYNDFRSRLVKDRTFENAMCTMMNNAIMGKSTIDKLKYM